MKQELINRLERVRELVVRREAERLAKRALAAGGVMKVSTDGLSPDMAKQVELALKGLGWHISHRKGHSFKISYEPLLPLAS